MLLDDEVLEDLQIKDYKIIQKKQGFKFSIDAVLLANFVKYKKNAKIADLGTGTGIIPILVCAKSDVSKIYAVEIQEKIASMAIRSVKLNRLDEKIEVLNINLKDSLEYIQKNSLDIVTSNPPYMPDDKLLSENYMIKISRNEVYCNIADIMRISSNLLKTNGKMYMVHRPSRLCDIFLEARKNNLEPKSMQMIYPNFLKPSNMILLQFTKNAKPEIKMLEPIYVYNENNEYTDKVKEIYAKDRLDFL